MLYIHSMNLQLFIRHSNNFWWFWKPLTNEGLEKTLVKTWTPEVGIWIGTRTLLENKIPIDDFPVLVSPIKANLIVGKREEIGIFHMFCLKWFGKFNNKGNILFPITFI